MYLLPLVITFLISASVAFCRSASKINHAAKSRNHYSHSWRWVLRAHPWTHHGIVAYFEAGGLGQTPMNRQTDRPTEEQEKSPPPTHGSSPRETERLNQLKVREEKFLVEPRFTSLARKKTTKTTTEHQMWDSDWSWQARSTTASPLSSLPLHTNQEIVEVCFFIPLVATPFAGVDACVCFFSLVLFISRVLTFKAGLELWSQPNSPTRRGSPLWPNNEVGKSGSNPFIFIVFPGYILCFGH